MRVLRPLKTKSNCTTAINNTTNGFSDNSSEELEHLCTLPQPHQSNAHLNNNPSDNNNSLLASDNTASPKPAREDRVISSEHIPVSLKRPSVATASLLPINNKVKSASDSASGPLVPSPKRQRLSETTFAGPSSCGTLVKAQQPGIDDCKPAARMTAPSNAERHRHNRSSDGGALMKKSAPESRTPANSDDNYHAWEENQPPKPNNYKVAKINNHKMTACGDSNCGPDDPALESCSVRTKPPAAATKSEFPEEFVEKLRALGLEIVEQDGDGNCLFRAVSLQVYGDANMHTEVRERALDFMEKNEEHFGQFVTGEPFSAYIARKRVLGVHGNNPEIQAVSELFNRPVEVFTPETGATPINIFHRDYETSDTPIRLSYHDGNHYNAVIDPLRPTAGLGLGLPGLKPGLADEQQLATAMTESDLQMDLEQAIKASKVDTARVEDDQLQRVLKESSFAVDTMYKDKALALSDIDATNFELEQTVLEYSLQAHQQSEGGRKQRASPSGRRRRQRSSSPDHGASHHADNPTSGGVARGGVPLVAAAAPAASAAARSVPSEAFAANTASSSLSLSPLEYPSVVQELAMNGFELHKVIHAYELIGDNFDDLVSFLLSNNS